MSQKNANKFLAGAVTATMVATAIVPTAAFAATPSFSDVDGYSAATKAELAKAVDLKFVNGYKDGTFKPSSHVTRGQVAKVLARQVVGGDAAAVKAYVETNKLEEKVTAFEDVTKEQDAELYYASLVVKNAGVFTGDKGKLSPDNSITRRHMAKVIVNAFGLKNTGAAVDIKDIELVQADFREYVTILAQHGVTNVDTFNPEKNVERIQLASFAVRAHEAAGKQDEVKELKVESVSAINAKQLKVTFNNAVGTGASTPANYDVKNVIGSAQNAVTNAVVQADGKSVVLTLTNAYDVATDVVVSVDNIYLKDSIKDKFPKFSTTVTVHDTVAPTLTSVSASTSTNAAQVVNVKFSEPIDTGAIFKLNGEVVTATPTTATIRDSFTISGQNLATDKVHELEVVGMKDYAGNEVAYTSKNFSVTKDSAPATGQVKLVSDNQVTVAFDKAMNLASLNNVDVLYYNAATSSYAPLTLTNLTGGNKAKLSADSKTATFQIAPSEKGKLFDANNTSAELLVKVKSGVVDTLGNAVKTFEQRITTTQDLTGPKLNSVTSDKNSKGEVTKLYFQFDEVLAAAPSNVDLLNNAKFVITNSQTNAPVANADVLGSALAAGDVVLAEDGKTVIVTPTAAATNKLTSGTYSFKVVAGNVADTSFEANTNKDTVATANFGAISNKTKVQSFVINAATVVDNKAVVTFDNAVKAETAKNPANYTINGKVLPADTVITVTSDRAVTFTLPKEFIAKTDNSAVIRVTGIQPVDGSSAFETYVGTAKVLDNSAPVANGKLLSDGTIQFTFTDAGVVTPAAADFAQVKLNGKLVATTATEATGGGATVLTTAPGNLPDGTPIVTLKVTPKVSSNHNSTGFTYQYIDVDGSGDLDFDKDIILKSVEATTAPGTWTTVADLNLLSSVEVITAATTATTDNSAYDDGNGPGNKLKPNTTIKVK